MLNYVLLAKTIVQDVKFSHPARLEILCRRLFL